MSSIFLAVNNTTGFMEMIFNNSKDAQTWADAMTAKNGDTYTIEEEDAC